MTAALAALLVGAAGLAHGQSLTTAAAPAAKPKVTLSTDSYTTGQAPSPDKGQYTGATTHSTMEWEGRGRWGVKLRLDQPVSRPVQTKDMEAGAYYKVTPAFRVGGALGLSDKPQAPTAPSSEDQVAPRVKLETTLKF
jgi:hypothetical protein